MTTVEPAQFLVLNDFLSPEERDELLTFVQDRDNFIPAKVTNPGEFDGRTDTDIRSAQVANDIDPLMEIFDDKLKAVLPHARRETGVGYFGLGNVERQVTAHGDGDFFEKHTDHGDPWTEAAGRRVSFVYYFHEHPRAFEGGELRLYDNVIADDGSTTPADTFQTIEPEDNSIVFFPSWMLHAVEPVRVTGAEDEPGSTRYTFNGWFHDRDYVRAVPPMEPEIRTALARRYTPSYTETGFAKINTPPGVKLRLRELYDARLGTQAVEKIDKVYLPTGSPDIIYIEDVSQQFLHDLQAVHEQWAGVELLPSAAYGLRIYREGHTLIPHTDTLTTHVISSIVHIAHETDEPWPLRIEDLEGNEHDVTLEEGEMLLYESARCPHSRPVPLQGAGYTSLFLHYRPVDWDVDYWTLLNQAIADQANDVLPSVLRSSES